MNKEIVEGCIVSFNYVLKDSDGTFIESNEGKDPLQFTQGAQQLVPGLEAAFVGMKEGESKDVHLSPEDGYGEIDPEAISEVPLEKIPEEARHVGAQLQTKDEQGNILMPIVSDIKDNMAVLDFNPPLAGKNLHFHITITDVQAAA